MGSESTNTSKLGKEKWIEARTLTVREFLINDVSTIQFQVFWFFPFWSIRSLLFVDRRRTESKRQPNRMLHVCMSVSACFSLSLSLCVSVCLCVNCIFVRFYFGERGTRRKLGESNEGQNATRRNETNERTKRRRYREWVNGRERERERERDNDNNQDTTLPESTSFACAIACHISLASIANNNNNDKQNNKIKIKKRIRNTMMVKDPTNKFFLALIEF